MKEKNNVSLEKNFVKNKKPFVIHFRDIKQKLIAGILATSLMIGIGFSFVGCGEKPKPEPIPDNPIVTDDPIVADDLYGTKVLYRPDRYDFSKSAGGTKENQKDYYGEYAWWIMKELVDVYGFADSSKIPQYTSSFIQLNEYSFFYDNIRFKVDAIAEVTKTKTVDASGNATTSDLSNENQYILVRYNPNQSWNMTFDYDLSGYNNAYNSLLFTNQVYTESATRVYSAFDSMSEYTQTSAEKYEEIKTFYYSTLLGSTSATDENNYSDCVKALQYAIYSYALDMTPGELEVTIEDNATTSTSKLYSLSIIEEDANGTLTLLSIDDALTNIKAKFQKLGTFVGLTENQVSKIADWVKTNVIGHQTKVINDNFFRYYDVTEVKTTDASGNVTLSYEFDLNNYSANPFGRNYANATNLIVNAMTEKVSIGTDGKNAITIDNRFLASEMIEYSGDTFLVAGDASFPKYTKGQYSTAIKPLEYQSVIIMPKKEITVSGIWIALKYDADLDGTTDGIYGTKYLDIIVELNYFSHQKQKTFKIGSQQTRVYDGPYAFSLDKTNDSPGTLFFDSFSSYCKDSEFKSLLDEGSLTIGKFNTSIGNNALITDVGSSGYIEHPLVSKSPLTILGTSKIKDFYTIVEPKENELSNINQTYSTGMANSEKFKGNDGCDYLEITYKVLKTKADTSTNYKFYTGIAAILDPTLDNPIITSKPEPTPPVYEGPKTMDEFYEDYNEEALAFAKETLKTYIAEDHDVLAYGYEIDDFSGKIKAVKARGMIYDGTERTIALDKITFDKQISIEDAFSGNCTSDDLKGTFTCDEYITFDYRMNYMEQDIIASLMQACKVTGGQNFYTEIYSINNDERSFLLGHVDPESNKIDVYNVVIYKRFESTLEDALKNPYSTRKTKVGPMGDYDFQIKQYIQETNVLPETFEELTGSCDKIMYEGLKGSFLTEIGSRFFRGYDETRIIDSTWTILRENDKITGFQVQLNYNDAPGQTLHRIFNITCTTPINYSDFAVENSKEILDNIAKKSTMSMVINFDYKNDQQSNIPDYAFSLGEKVLGYESGKYYFKIESYTFNSDQWGEAQRLQIMKITKNEVKTATIIVKVGSTSEKYEQNVENGYYTILEQTSEKLINGDEIFFVEEREVEAELK